jgi:hypothetical protein
MTSEKSEKKTSKPAESTTGLSATPNLEQILSPFQTVSAKFLQQSHALKEDLSRQQARAWLALADEIRRTEYEAHLAMTAALRKHLDTTEQQPAGTPEEISATRARAQADCEQELRQISADLQTKLTSIYQRAADERAGGEELKQLAARQQEAYQAYMSDLQRAWVGVPALDPQIMHTIASNIMFTINAASHGI